MKEEKVSKQYHTFERRAGLVNFGNTCYLNSSVQMLATILPLCEYLEATEF
jgi:ubiquitin C-terminal hydrolase